MGRAPSCDGLGLSRSFRSSGVSDRTLAERTWLHGGDRDDAIPLMHAAVDHLVREGQLLEWGIAATGVLVETLLDRGAESDVAEAEAAVTRLADAPADDGAGDP